MSQSLNQNFVHIVFSTKHRKHLIRHEFETHLHQYITGICKHLSSPVIRINGVEDHVHILLILSKNIALAKLVEEIKKKSSKWIKHQYPDNDDFYWQNGYGAFSVSPRHVELVTKYIDKQKEHHARKTFQQEFINFLETYKVEYDERYVWD